MASAHVSPAPSELSAASITWRTLQKLDDVGKHSMHPADPEAERRIHDRYLSFLNGLKGASSRLTAAAVLYYRSSEATSAGLHECGHGFYSAFERAWATHGAVLLSPDDVWQAVQLQFCQYMDANSEELRSLFVEHAGKVELNIAMERTGDWELFMQRTMSAIQSKCKRGVQADFLPAFSSSTELSRALQRLAVMDCMQHYFSYRYSTCCGIERMGFLGSLEDWQRLRSYVAGLARFHLPNSKYFDSLKGWVDATVAIVDQFIVTYRGEAQPPVDFWNRVINLRHTYGSGGSSYVKGWITTFLTGGDFTRELDVQDIPAHRFNVPVTVDANGHVYRVRMLGGFTGVKEEANVYRAQSSLIVIKVGEGEEPTGRVNPSPPKSYQPM